LLSKFGRLLVVALFPPYGVFYLTDSGWWDGAVEKLQFYREGGDQQHRFDCRFDESLPRFSTMGAKGV